MTRDMVRPVVRRAVGWSGALALVAMLAAPGPLTAAEVSAPDAGVGAPERGPAGDAPRRPVASQDVERDAGRDATWRTIAPDIFPGRQIGAAEGLVALDAPGRAEDAALVPLTVALTLPAGDPRRFRAVTVVIDENPSPVAGRFTFGPDQGDFVLSLRARVNSYSQVRAIAETDDGALHMATVFVKAAGGCSAPATKDTAESIAHLGDIRFRSFAEAGRAEAQVQIRHPNFSGLQMDEATRGYTPAWFVREVAITQGGRLLLGMEGGISISEDPTFRFTYHPSTAPVTVRGEDTEGKVFSRTFPGGGS
ncbi:quinoprotein dehydrogenase-associated SoxYZ-like carrier [Xanthobacter sp. V4C-4]|uniref:quinoprotein dehydrogenase-associated SoxYZ-like carrier n=1 Tax=Xanthobacter cornucopiae TaxID=3119924 RepID=UPI00372CC3BB